MTGFWKLYKGMHMQLRPALRAVDGNSRCASNGVLCTFIVVVLASANRHTLIGRLGNKRMLCPRLGRLPGRCFTPRCPATWQWGHEEGYVFERYRSVNEDGTRCFLRWQCEHVRGGLSVQEWISLARRCVPARNDER
jgi:hypothetical protein